MSATQGLLIREALIAVMQMHSDSARLLRDFDQWMDTDLPPVHKLLPT
jgi:hypothetical protein